MRQRARVRISPTMLSVPLRPILAAFMATRTFGQRDSTATRIPAKTRALAGPTPSEYGDCAATWGLEAAGYSVLGLASERARGATERALQKPRLEEVGGIP